MLRLLSLWLSLSSAARAEDPADQGPVERTYAMRQTFTSQMREPNPFSSQEWRSTRTNTYAIVRWTQAGTQVSWTETTCGLHTDKVFGAETIYPDAFIRNVEVRNRVGVLSGAGPGATFKAGPFVQSFGVRLADPMRDPLPTTEDDPRLIDSDGDGHPGITVMIRHPMVGQGQVFVAQRSIARIEGTVNADGTVSGHILTAPDMYKIGADRWWLKVDSPQRPHPDPAQSPFMMVPVTDGISCGDLLARKGDLFPALPAPR